MRNIKEVNLRRLTRNTSWSGFVVFLVFAVFVTAGIFVAASSYISLLLETKIHAYYDEVSELVEIYENGQGQADTERYELMDSKVLDYYITDETGRMLHNKGEVEEVDESDLLTVDSLYDNVYFYTKSSYGIIKRDDGPLLIDTGYFIRLLRGQLPGYKNGTDFLRQRELFSLPIWVRVPVRNGSESLFCRLDIVFAATDIIYVIVFFVIITVMMFVVLVVTLVSAITTAVRRARMINLLFTDLVTKGRNWMWFEYKGNPVLKRSRNQVRKYAVVNIELIRYANFCVCHSLVEGEEYLGKVSRILEKNVMRGELAAHATGGDFAMLLKFTSDAAIKKRVSHIIEQLQTISNDHKFSFHAGIAVFDISKTGDMDRRNRRIIDIEREYHYAYAAKDTLSGSDDSGVAMLDDKLIEDQKWIDIVNEKQQSALDNEEFVIYYQPKYNPRNDTLCGAEALIRWQSPDYGFVTPNRIIPIFEQNGFITEIDHYMIKHVARDQKRWFDAGYRCVPVSVNVSRAHFIEDDLAEQIRDMVDSEGCPHEYIEIELTESAFFDDKKALLNTIEKLKKYGFAVSMDDFGSGYSSLNSLKDMPLDILKLDAEFFRGEQGDGRGEIVVKEAIKLAKNLDMRIVAEGVEVKEQVDFLADQGCDMIQGYFYAKPMPGTDYEQRMKEAMS